MEEAQSFQRHTSRKRHKTPLLLALGAGNRWLPRRKKRRKRACHGTDVWLCRADAGRALREAPGWHIGCGLAGARRHWWVGQCCGARRRSADGDAEDRKRWTFPN
jgi:hypothetical protein